MKNIIMNEAILENVNGGSNLIDDIYEWTEEQIEQFGDRVVESVEDVGVGAKWIGGKIADGICWFGSKICDNHPEKKFVL